MPLSIITGKLSEITGANGVRVIRFVPLSTPMAASPVLIVGMKKKSAVSDSDGEFSVELREGDYLVLFEDSGPANEWEQVQIAVPTTMGTYNILDLITSSITYPPTSPVGIPADANAKIIAGQFCIWDDVLSGWRPLTADNGILGCGDLIPDP